MEGFQWVRIGAIVALVLGAVYLLLPTIAGEAAEEQIRSAASAEVPTAGTRHRATMSFDLEVTEGEPEAVAEALEQRFAAAGVGVRGVEAEGTLLTVRIEVGTFLEAARAVAAMRGDVAVYPPNTFGELPPKDAPPAAEDSGQALTAALRRTETPDPSYWRAVLGNLAGAEVPQGSAERGALDGFEPGEDGVRALLVPEGPLPTPHLLVVDGEAIAAVFSDGSTVALRDEPAELAVVRALAAPEVPGAVQLVEDEEGPVAAAGATDDAPDAGSGANLPPWLVGILPDTRIALGLDLQGGIDLTLQVELEQALLGQAARDTLYLEDAAAKEGLVFESVRRAATEAVIEITTDAELAAVNAFMADELNEYQYLESDGRTHRYDMREERQAQVKEQAVTQVLETLRKRVDETGVKEPSIVKKGGGRINVQLPGATDVQSAVDIISTAAVLHFRMVNEDFDDAYLEEIVNTAQDRLPPDQFFDDAVLNEWLWKEKLLDLDTTIRWTEPGNEKQWYGGSIWTRAVAAEGVELEAVPYPLMNEIPLTGNDVNNAGVGFDQQTGIARVSLEFKPRGGTIFCDITGEAVGKRFAIILDEVVQSTPNIRERICGGSASIEMSSAVDPMQEAQALATVLRTGALDAPVVVASVRQVGASLGADSIRLGSLGALVGALIILVFMGAWYRTAGLIADLALVVNIMLVLAALAATGATLTLPGIAGIALTVGMAVDANIIIYERVREELRLGVPPRKAVDVGFDKAVVAVLDANITTAIAGIVLFSYGTGPIRGFAVTLLIGIVTTLVTALFITRTVMELVTRSSTARLRI